MTTEGFYPMLFEFEKNFDQGSARHWVQANWVPLCSSAGFEIILPNLSSFDLTLTGLISPYSGLSTFSSSTLVEGGWPPGLLLTYEAASLPGALLSRSSASLAS